MINRRSILIVIFSKIDTFPADCLPLRYFIGTNFHGYKLSRTNFDRFLYFVSRFRDDISKSFARIQFHESSLIKIFYDTNSDFSLIMTNLFYFLTSPWLLSLVYPPRRKQEVVYLVHHHDSDICNHRRFLQNRRNIFCIHRPYRHRSINHIARNPGPLCSWTRKKYQW